jgi:hypothetical protein
MTVNITPARIKGYEDGSHDGSVDILLTGCEARGYDSRRIIVTLAIHRNRSIAYSVYIETE